MEELYKIYIKQCIELAKNGEGHVSPNPLVGAIVLDKDGNFAGSGWHQKYGEPHAEPNAIKNAEQNGFDCKGGTIFVSLEPCCHYGKTPPCADLIISKGFKKVIIGCTDPNPKVAGKGIEKLKAAGIEVISGVLEEECKTLNEIFIKNQLQKAPFVAIKTATTLDGKIATKTGSSKWITAEKARKQVHRLRNKFDAIITGSGTVIADDPSMTCRLTMEEDGICGRNPVRVIVDSGAKTDPCAKIFADDGTKVILAVCENIEDEKISKYPPNVEILKCSIDAATDKLDLKKLTALLYERGCCSLLVEAGGYLNGAFLKAGLADKVYQFIAPKILGDDDAMGFVRGFDVAEISQGKTFKIQSVQNFDPDILVTYS